MPRQIRLEYAGAIYHVLSWGDRREPIFLDEGGRHDFLKTLAEACAKTGFLVHAYCLMRNHFYLTEPRHRPQGLRVERLLGEHGIGQDSAAGRREFERRMEGRRAGEGDAEQWKGMRRGWCLGSEAFKRGLLERLHGQLGPSHGGAMRRQANQARAEWIIAAELKRRRWPEAELSRRAKSDPVKLALAARLRRETTLTLQEIADLLQMGSRKRHGSQTSRLEESQ